MKKSILLVLVLAFCLTVEVAQADFTFGEPTNLGPAVNDAGEQYGPSVSADGLELYFYMVNPPGGYGRLDLYVTTGKTRNAPWGPPVNLGPQINSAYCECVPRVSADGLSLFFSETDVPGTPLLPGGYGGAG